MKNSLNEKKKEKDKDKDKEKEKEQFKIPQLSYNFNMSNIIVKNIIEKIISLTITRALQNKISNQIPSFCFQEIKDSLNLALYIDFINYDKDDVIHQKNLLDYVSKSNKNISKIKKEPTLITTKSEIIRKYKFNKELDPNISYEGSINVELFHTPKKEKEKYNEQNNNKNYFVRYYKNSKKKEDKKKEKDPNLGKLLNGLIIREIYDKKDIEKNKYNILYYQRGIKNVLRDSDKEIKEEKDEPFEIQDDNIEKIKKLESHKIDINPNYFDTKEKNNIIIGDFLKLSKNSWLNIEQPKVPPIDRDAGTKINYIKNIPKLIKMQSLNIPQNDSSKLNNLNKDILSSKDSKNKNIKKSKIKKQIDTEDNNNLRKKKYAPILEFPSEDIDPKVLGGDTESAELKKLRENLEKELIEKKLEQSRKLQKEREIQALEKAREEKRKELANKNVTVDIKGEIIYIKSLNINDFVNDFTRMRSKQKEIKIIQSPSKNILIQKATVEKNPLNIFEQMEKEKPKKKVKRNLYGHRSAKNDEKPSGGNTNKNIWIGDRKRDPILAAGSNFEIISPECGVAIKENEKTKSGGKDFYGKYHKYSLEIFEETFNKTISSNFYSMQGNTIFNNNLNNTNMSNNNTVNRNLKKLKSKNLKDENKSATEGNKTKNLSLPSEINNKLLVKAKNLKLALNNLDLITESEEKYYSTKKKNKNIMKQNMEENIPKKNRNNYDEINKFAKTLVGRENWGDNLFHQKKSDSYFKKPQKPQDIELRREVPLNLLHHLPRKRLPPINVKMNNNLSMGYTMSDGFFGRKKKMKIFLSEENNKKEGKKDDNDNKNNEKKEDNEKFGYSTTTGFLPKKLDG